MKTRPILAALALAFAAGSACAQATIDHNKALAGGVTPGDGAGYPVTLSQPGHYKLTGNLSVPAGTTGILITSPGVTLDLNGFSVAGPATCAQSTSTRAVTCSAASNADADGIRVQFAVATLPAEVGVKIRNGTVRGFANWGVLGMGGETIEDLRVTQNVMGGVTAQTDDEGTMQVRRSVVHLNGGIGIGIGAGTVESTSVVSNGGDGISGNASVVVRDCFVRRNADIGLRAVAAQGTAAIGNGAGGNANRFNVKSLGGNLDNGTVF